MYPFLVKQLSRPKEEELEMAKNEIHIAKKDRNIRVRFKSMKHFLFEFNIYSLKAFLP